MESLTSMFLVFIAAILAMLSYLVIPKIPVSVLMIGAAVALGVGAFVHWDQFAVDYRTSTWQEQLRNYASYFLLLLVIILSYTFYMFGWKNSSFAELATRGQTALRNAGRKVASQVVSASRGVTSAASALVSEGPSTPAVPTFAPVPAA